MSKATDILKIISESLEGHPEFGNFTTTLYDPTKSDNKVTLGVMAKVEGGLRKRYSITVDDHAFSPDDLDPFDR